MLSKDKKEKIIKQFGRHQGDTGSSEVQIAVLCEEIRELIGHLKTHKKDFSSRRGLLKKVSERRKLLRYLEHENAQSFEKLVQTLKLKPPKKIENKKEEPDLAILEGEEVAGAA